MGGLAEKARGLASWHGVRDASEAKEGQRILLLALPPQAASLLTPAELEPMRTRLMALPEPPVRPGIDGETWRGALGILLLVFVSTFPVAIPFLFVQEIHRALRLSNAIAVGMLFLCGYSFGRMTRYHPWGMGLAMVLLGCALVAMTMALGG
jgi:VIT1/CCC1 family predicted Fe2+/Mn2+ transporter